MSDVKTEHDKFKVPIWNLGILWRTPQSPENVAPAGRMEVIEIEEKCPNKWNKCNNEYEIQYNQSVSSSLTYDHFFSAHLLPNLPCVIQSGITNEWPCAQQWRVDGAPNFKCLKQLYGENFLHFYSIHEHNCAIIRETKRFNTIF